jgi:hypothetical protein
LQRSSSSTDFLDEGSFPFQRSNGSSTYDSKAALSRLPTLCTNPKNPRYNGSRPDGCFYYRNERHGDRVVKKYYGRGVVGELAARMAADALRKRQKAARAIRDLRDRLAPADNALGALEADCDVLLGSTLLASGFHRSNHCAWRRRRVQGR